jgi:hypothetical protein
LSGLESVNWDKTLDKALAGEQPQSVPIFPWHFADFVEKDPPLIDVSLDFEQSSYYLNFPVVCKSPQHKKLPRKLSAPEISLSSARSF